MQSSLSHCPLHSHTVRNFEVFSCILVLLDTGVMKKMELTPRIIVPPSSVFVHPEFLSIFLGGGGGGSDMRQHFNVQVYEV